MLTAATVLGALSPCLSTVAITEGKLAAGQEPRDPSEWGAHFCFLYLLALVGTIAVRRTLGGLAGTQGHCASLLDFELERRKAGALEEVGAITEGLVGEKGGELTTIIVPSAAMSGSQGG